MTDKGITRPQFVRDTVAAAAAAGLTATYTVHAGNPDKADTGKIVNYHSDMEYRRCGRTGLITVQEVDNVALAVKERRELDVDEKAELERAMQRAWANLPHEYQWLRDWEYV